MKALSVYLSGASNEIDLCKRYRDRLVAAGFTITHDWMAAVEAAGAANPVGATHDQHRHWAREDLAGIIRARIFWLLVPQGISFGAAAEFGYALRRWDCSVDFSIVVSGDHRKSVFLACGEHRFDSHEEAFACICVSR